MKASKPMNMSDANVAVKRTSDAAIAEYRKAHRAAKGTYGAWDLDHYQHTYKTATPIETVQRIIRERSRQRRRNELVRFGIDAVGPLLTLKTTWEAIVLAHADLFTLADVCMAIDTLHAVRSVISEGQEVA